MCDDREGSFVRTWNLSGLQSLDKKTRFSEVDAPGGEFYLDSVYRVRLVHDGKTVSLFVDDELVRSVPSGPRTGGGLFFWLHSDMSVQLRELTIEGELDPQALEYGKEDWVRQQVAALSD